MVKFARFTDEERLVVDAIVDRARAIWRQFGMRPPSRQSMTMDLSAVHAHTPLRLAELLAADDFNFTHDIGGIAKHLNRQTGELEDCFLPRFAA